MRRLALFVFGLFASGLAILTPLQGAQAYTSGILKVQPSYDASHVDLIVDTYEDRDALPDYALTLTDVSTGASVPMGFGYANTERYSEREGPYNQATAGQLTVGATYEAFFHYTTVGYTDCSIYYSDGCHWIKGTASSARWRFIYTGETSEAAPFDAPTKVVAKTVKRGAHGWATSASLTSGGQPLAGVLRGEYRTNRGWVFDNTFKTNRRGVARIKFEGETNRTSYRLTYEGETYAASHSKPFSITRR